RRGVGLVGNLLVLAVGTAKETEQLHFLGAGHDLVGTAELHAGLGQLFQQFLHRRVDQLGELADGGLLRHSDPMIFWAPPRQVRRQRGVYALSGSGHCSSLAHSPRSNLAISSARAARTSAAARSRSTP